MDNYFCVTLVIIFEKLKFLMKAKVNSLLGAIHRRPVSISFTQIIDFLL